MSEEPRHDRIWIVEWAHQCPPDGSWPPIPPLVLDQVADLAATLGAALDEAHTDAHDDLGGGDPDLLVWRFTFRVPDTSEPADPDQERYRDSHAWPIAPQHWPPTVAQLAARVAGHASTHVGAGTLRVAFSPAATGWALVQDAIAATYGTELAAIELALEPFRAAHTSRSGDPLPERHLHGFAAPDGGGTGYATFYVGEIAYRPTEPDTDEDAYLWRVVTAGLAADGRGRPPANGATPPALPVPPPTDPDEPWVLLLSGREPHPETFRGPLPEALAQLTARLRQIGAAPS